MQENDMLLKSSADGYDFLGQCVGHTKEVGCVRLYAKSNLNAVSVGVRDGSAVACKATVGEQSVETLPKPTRMNSHLGINTIATSVGHRQLGLQRQPLGRLGKPAS